MHETERLKYLRIALVVVGVIAIFALYILMIVWPSGWAWHSGHSDYPLMIVGIYATLGVFLILAAREPSRIAVLSGSLSGPVWFTASLWLCRRLLRTVASVWSECSSLLYRSDRSRAIDAARQSGG